jgi:hypothetical protein
MVAVDAVIIEVLSCNNASMRYRMQRAVGLRGAVVVCSHNTTRRKADRLAFEVSHPLTSLRQIAEKTQKGSLASYRDAIELSAVAAGRLSGVRPETTYSGSPLVGHLADMPAHGPDVSF